VVAGLLRRRGVCLRAAAARDRPAVLSGVFSTLGARQSPPPLQGALSTHYGLGFAGVFSQDRLSLGIRRLPCPGFFVGWRRGLGFEGWEWG